MTLHSLPSGHREPHFFWGTHPLDQRPVRTGYGNVVRYGDQPDPDRPARGRSSLLGNLVAGTAALAMIVLLGGCVGAGSDGSDGTDRTDRTDRSAEYTSGDAPELHTVVALHTQPQAQSPVAGQITDPDCRTIHTAGPGDTPLAPSHTDQHGQVWFQLGDAWVLNDGFCH